MWNKGFLQAIEVGNLVEEQLPKFISFSKMFNSDIKDFKTDEWYIIEALQNCREQGITIWVPNVAGKESLTFYVCINRHSNDIGFYYGKHTFHGVSKDAYEREFYSFDSVDGCAEAIALHIKAHMQL